MLIMSVPFSDTDNRGLTSLQFSTYLWDSEPVEVCAVTDCVPRGTGNQPQHLPKKGLSCQKNLKIKNSYPMKKLYKENKILTTNFPHLWWWFDNKINIARDQKGDSSY